MAADEAGPSDDLAFLPERVARRAFSVSLRGFDQLEVRTYLGELANELRLLREREAQLREELTDARLLAAPGEGVDEARLIAILGEETARVLDAARQAAGQIRAKAEESAARMLREAQDEIVRMRAEAELDIARRSEEAEQAVAAGRVQAEEAASALRAEAERIRQESQEEAALEVVAARERGREMVGEAQRVRERVLKDLARRRRLARQQIEQLRAGRERLLAAYQVVRQTLDQATDELLVALPQAREAAEAAGRLVPEEEPTIEELEAEVTALAAAPISVEEPAETQAAVAEEQIPWADAEPEPEPAPAEAPAADAPAADAPAGDVAEEVPQEVPAVPEPPDEDVVEERRSSTLRLFRRRSHEPEPEHHSPEVARPSGTGTFEAVRILRPAGEAAEAEPEAPPPAEAEPEIPAAEVEPEPEPPEPEPALVSVPLPAEPPRVSSKVDELFARMRAERAEAVARAQGVLDEEPAPAPADAVEQVAEAVEEPDEGPSVLERRAVVVEPLEQAMARRLKRELADEQNEVLDRLRRRRGKSVLDEVVAGPDEHADRYRRAVGESVEASWRAGIDFIGNGEAEQGPSEELLAEVAREIVEPIRERLERALAEASGDDDELADRVRACYREWRTGRAEQVASHLVLAAFSGGVYAAAPEDSRLCWVVDNGGMPCPDADDNALAGAIRKGETFPTGHLRPPAHPGCRCLALPEHH